jgi:hypothetical protein
MALERRKPLALAGIEHWTIQCVATRYAGYAIMATVCEKIIFKLVVTRYDRRVCTGVIWFCTETSDNLL